MAPYVTKQTRMNTAGFSIDLLKLLKIFLLEFGKHLFKVYFFPIQQLHGITFAKFSKHSCER